MDANLLYSVKPDATVLSPDRRTVLSFDREGRLFSYWRDGLTYRRDLASRVYVRGGEHRWWVRLSEADARQVLAEAYAVAEAVRRHAPAPLLRRLEQEILRWTPERLAAEAGRFAAAYPWPPSILPPDRYLSTVLQVTFGCSWNRCTFCALYRDRAFRTRSIEDFTAHAEAVRRLLGRQWRHRQGLFLGDGNALALSLERLTPLIRIARRLFPGQELYGFVDLYSGQRGEPEKWRALARWGLRRVYIGMETGSDELLTVLNKPGSARELVDFVGVLKGAGLAVGLIIMVGAGGRPYAQRHAEATLAALAAMPLGRDDLVYLSPFLEQPDSPYPALRQQLGLEPLAEDEIERELTALTQQIRRLGVRVGRYDLRAFVY